MVPVRAGLFALIGDPVLLVLIQMLDGLTVAIIGVLTALVISDLTDGTGRFNLAQGLVGTFSTLGVGFSTLTSGFVVEWFGHAAAFASASLIGMVALASLWLFL